MKIEKLKKIYFVENPEKILGKKGENFLMCSTKNWNYYFEDLSEKTKKKKDFFEELKNLNLIEFDSENEMFDYLDKKDPHLIVDWSLEHNKPLVLEFDKI